MFFDKSIDFANWGRNYAADFFEGFNSVLTDGADSFNVAQVFGFAESMFEPLLKAAEGVYDKTFGQILDRIPVVGQGLRDLADTVGGAWGPLKDYTLALTELGDQWISIERIIAGQTLDLTAIDKFSESVNNIYSRGLIVRDKDIFQNLGEISTRIKGLSQQGLEDLSVKFSQVNEILGGIDTKVSVVTGGDECVRH